MYINWFLNICKLCFGYEKIGIVEKNKKNCLALCNEDETIEHIITPKEFDDIMKIILNQNDSSYDNRYINPEVRELMESYYKAKYNNMRSPTLEEKKAYVTSKTGISIFDRGSPLCQHHPSFRQIPLELAHVRPDILHL